MSRRDDQLLLGDILQAARKITIYSEGFDFENFMMNDLVKDAIIRNFEVIGEAAKNISIATKALHPAIEWKLMSNFRNRLIHEYFGIDYELVWDIIQNELQTLITQIEQKSL